MSNTLKIEESVEKLEKKEKRIVLKFNFLSQKHFSVSVAENLNRLYIQMYARMLMQLPKRANENWMIRNWKGIKHIAREKGSTLYQVHIIN